MFTRQLGSILRGRATRLQVMLATVLGGMLGFVPGFFLPGDLGGGFAQAPGLILLLLCVALVANANLAVFGLTLLLAKLASMALLPVSYTVGTWIVDGPLQGVVRWLCNTRVSAWFGFERYATTGGLCLGLILGAAFGFVINASLRAIRRKMASVEQNSEGYQKYASKWWVRGLTWAFLGKGKGKKTWQDLAGQKAIGMPIRILGVVLAVAFVGSVLVFQQWFSTPILTTNLQQALVAGNGATVDVGSASLSLAAGEIRVTNFAMADAARPETRDLLAADSLVMRLDMQELLRRRFVIDEVSAVNARGGTARATPGVRIPSGKPAPAPAPPPAGIKVPTLDEITQEYELWKGRLEQARGWVDLVFGDDGDQPGTAPSPGDIAADRQRQLEQVGMAGVVAHHLLEGGPRVLIRKFDVEGITWTHGDVQEQVALRMRNISTEPSLVDGEPSITIGTGSQSFELGFTGRSARKAQLGLQFAARGLAVDQLLGGLKLGGVPPLAGGSVDLAIGGALAFPPGQDLAIDLPLSATLRDTTFTIAGRSTPVDRLVLPIGLTGSWTAPAVHFDAAVLRDAVLAAGKQELARLITDNAGKLLGEVGGKLGSELQGIVDPSKTPEQMLDAAKQKLEAEKKKQEEELKKKAEEELKKRLPGGLEGLLGGKKKKEGGQ